jgi:hypothetical protein
MLDTLHVPLVDDDNDSLALGLINLFEELFVLLIDENSLELREESSACLRVPINLMLIQAFLGEGSWTHKWDLGAIADVFSNPLRVTPLEALNKVINQVHSGLVGKLHPGLVVEFTTKEMNFSTNPLSGLTSVLDFETWSFESKVVAKAEEASKQSSIHAPSKHLKPVATWVPNVALWLAKVASESAGILIHLLLRVNILQQLGAIPPLLTCLQNDSVRLQLFDELFGPVCEHRALVAGADEVDILSVEAFCQLYQGGFEAGLSESN